MTTETLNGVNHISLEDLGCVVWLLCQSKSYETWNMKNIYSQVLPPLITGQCRLFRKQGKPFAFVTWAYLSNEVEKQYISGREPLSPADWKSGTNFWFIDLVIPYGGLGVIAEKLQDDFPDQKEVKFIRRKTDAGSQPVTLIRRT